MKRLFTFFVICIVFTSFIQAYTWRVAQENDTEDNIIFSETFDTEEDFNKWYVYNLNESVTWILWNQMATHLLDLNVQWDDWLISPAFPLETGKMYKLSFIATVPSTSNYKESFKVTIGSSENPDSHTMVLADYPEYTSSEEVPTELVFFVENPGSYHVGFYGYSQVSTFRLMIDDVIVSEAGSTDAPGSVTDEKIIPGSNGELTAEISFTAPTVTYSGSSLEQIESIFIYRNAEMEEAHVFTNPSPGEKLSWTDTKPLQAINSYRIVTANQHGKGPKVSTSAYIGTDIPVAVTEAKTEVVNEVVRISWTAPEKGINNGYINPQSLRYKVVRNDGTVISEDVSETGFNDTTLDTKAEQQRIYYTIYPISSAGEGEGAETNRISIGAPFNLPFKESFADADYENTVWTIETLEGDNDIPWIVDSKISFSYLDTRNPQDEDGGLIYFNSYWFYGTARLISPFIDISSAINPKITFWLLHYHPDDTYGYDEYYDHIQLEISINNSDFTEIGEPVYVMKDKINGWTQYEVSLLPYKDSEKIQIAFKGISDYGYDIAIDNILIEDKIENDLHALALSGSKRISINEEEKYALVIKNEGAFTTSDYTAEFYINGNLVESKNGISIEPDAQGEIEFTYTAVMDEITKDEASHHLTAKIVFDKDEVPGNNDTELYITVRAPGYPEVTGLNADADHETLQIKLSWEEPVRVAATRESVIEGFENYEAFSIEDWGEWTLLDMDRSQTYSNNGVTPPYDNKGKPMSFQIFNPADVSLDDDWLFTPNSGAQYAMCPAAENGPNNDWLISPMLPMIRQTVSFWAKSVVEHFGLERIVFWYSMTDNHPDSFIQLSEGEYIQVPTLWRQYSYTVPVGARYFAIQCVSDDAIMLFIDDISFIKSNGDPESLVLLGYNVYRDGKQLNEELINETSYVDNLTQKDTYTYKVTAVYDKGESVYSEEVEVDLTVNGIASNALSRVNIYANEKTLTIEGISDDRVSVISIDGKLIYNSQFKEKLQLDLEGGIYIVKVGSQTTKVRIK